MKYFAPENSIFHCPICGRELTKNQYTEGGWLCKCKEFIPEGLAVNAFLGSTERINPHEKKSNKECFKR